jgi:GGDEF domain-containing protein
VLTMSGEVPEPDRCADSFEPDAIESLRGRVTELEAALETERERNAELEHRNEQLHAEFEAMTEINVTLARHRYRDNDELSAREREIARLESEKDRDGMTGLLAKDAWMTNVESMIKNDEEEFGVLFIDLSNFKRINDDPKLGHLFGDSLIKRTAGMLVSTLRGEPEKKDVVTHERLFKSPEPEDDQDHDVSRYGGDEFAVLCDLTPRGDSDLTPEERLQTIIHRLRDSFDRMLEGEDERVRDHRFDLAIGGSVFEPGMTLEELLKSADKAMYADKFARKAAWQEGQPIAKRVAHRLGNALLRFSNTLNDR